MKKRICRMAALWLSLMMLVVLLPTDRGWAEEPDRTEDMTETAEEPAVSESPVDGTDDEQEVLPPKQVRGSDAVSVTVEDIVNGDISIDQEDGVISGTAVPDAGYDLATIRLLHSDDSQEYIDYEKDGDSYVFTIDAPADSCRLTAYFFSLTQWDGAVDLTWYDPQEDSFDISTPAQLAGLASIVNGMVDDNNTEEWMIKDPGGREAEDDGSYTHRYVSTEPWDAFLLTPNTDAAVTDTVWRLPKHDAILAEDDCYHDFRYRTINITADIDMAGERIVTDGQTSETRQLNWTPIGGKYAMNPEETKSGVNAKVIDTRFQGVFEGNGHTITIHCNRYAKMGFAYSWAIGVIGYLGGGVDYKNGYPKDTFIEYAQPWVPTARDLIVQGDVLGRRMAGGVIGRTGETNYGVVVERCANYATVQATDMRGCAGIVAAAWGDTVIRQCYNAGTIKSAYAEHGGIVGSNGYEGSGSYEGRTDFRAAGASIYNCYNIGDTTRLDAASGEYQYDGHEIGIDGEAFAKYTVANCFYLTPQGQIDEKKIGYCRGEVSANTRAKCRNVTAVDNMGSSEVLAALNQNGNVFAPDDENINGGAPVLYFQTEAYRQASSLPEAELTVGETEHGTVTASQTGMLAYGTTVGLKATPVNTTDQKYRFNSYLIQDGAEEKTPQYGDFYTITGNSVTVGAVFEETGGVSITFAEENDVHVHYYVNATKVYDVDTGECEVALHSEDRVNVGDRIKLVPHMKKTFINKDGEEEPVHPDLKTLEYTGDIGSISFEEGALERKSALSTTYTVTGETDEINIEYALKTQGKRWTSTADTSWYLEGSKSFTLTTAKQIAGVAVLCEDGVSFKGVTLKLGNDISLENTKANSGDKYPSERSWIGIGTDRYPFEGIFDGQGHTIKYMTRNFYVGYCPGSNGGLFGVTENAVIKNVTVEGGSYENSDDDPDNPAVLRCAFKNGAKGGGIVGEAVNSTITNCHCSVNMEEAATAGGIVGTAEGSTTVADCSYAGAFSEARNNIGGIVGRLEGSGARIERCVNRGAISATSNNVGGILGYGGTGSAAVKRCVNEGDIHAAMQGSTTQQSGSAGGILGFAGGALSCVESYNKGKVTGENRAVALGGIAGAVSKATIKDCYNTGDIYSNSDQGAAQVAGITNLGFSNANHASLINCYNTGKISTGDKFTTDRRGGIAGYGNTSTNTVSNCYCSASSVAQIGKTAGIAGTVLGDDQLKQGAKRLGASFVPDADSINNGYPVLLWQDPDFIGTAILSSVAKSSDTAIVVAWQGKGNCTGYNVYRSTSAGGKYTKAGSVKKGAALKFADSGLAYGNTYYYKVVPYRDYSGGSFEGTATVVKSCSLVPGATKISSAKNKKKRTVNLKWKKVSGASGYQIYRSTKSNKGFKKIATIKKGSKLTYKDKKVKKKKTYYYKIRAYKVVNKHTGYGAYSAAKKIKVKR